MRSSEESRTDLNLQTKRSVFPFTFLRFCFVYSCKILRFHCLQRRVISTRGSPTQCHVEIFVNSQFLHGKIISHTVSQLVVSRVVIFYRVTTGGPSSSCEMIILRNNGHGGIIRVCIGIFTSALRNKKIRQILKKKNLTSLPQRIACYLTAYFEKSPFERVVHFEVFNVGLFLCTLKTSNSR